MREQPTLFPQVTVSLVEQVRPEPRGSAPVRQIMRDERGEHWHAKGFYFPAQLLAEGIGHRLAQVVGVPTPPWGVAIATQACASGVFWCSKTLARPIPWDVGHMYQVVNLEDVGALLTLDALLCVPDRHHQNLLLQRTENEDEVSYRAVAIDFDRAAIADPNLASEIGLALPKPTELLRELDLDAIRDRLWSTADVLFHMGEAQMQSLVLAAASDAGLRHDAVEDVVSALLVRKRGVRGLVSSYATMIEGTG